MAQGTMLPRAPEFVGSSPLGQSIVPAFHRLNPVGDLECDLVVATGGVKASSQVDWTTGAAGAITHIVETGVAADAMGVLRLVASGTAAIFANTAAATVLHSFKSASGAANEEVFLDFFVEPGTLPNPFTVHSIDVKLGRQFDATVRTFSGNFICQLYQWNELWTQRKAIGSPVLVAASSLPATGTATATVDFTGKNYLFAPGRLSGATGAGWTSAGAVRASQTIVIPKALSLGIRPFGLGAENACIALTDNATLANLDPTTFWRAQTAPGYDAAGPYTILGVASPAVVPIASSIMTTGPIPGFGALAVGNGAFGTNPWPVGGGKRGQTITQPWAIPYHNVLVDTITGSGTWVGVFNMGAVPTNDVEFRADYTAPGTSSLTFSLRGSNASDTGAWTAIGAVADGTVLTGANKFQWYELTVTFTANTGATKYATPALQAVFLTQRQRFSTFRLDQSLDATQTLDPVTGQSQIPELKVPFAKLGPRGADLMTNIAAQYAPSSIEARVYAVNRVSGVRYFLNSYRMESRESKENAEEFTFLGGTDRLKALVPVPVESYTFSPSAAQAVSAVSVTGSDVQITVGGTPNFPTTNPNEYGFVGVQGYLAYVQTGQQAGQWFPIISTRSASASSFWITPASTAQTKDYPAAGDLVSVHSVYLVRNDKSYDAQDYAVIFADLLQNQAQIPFRLQGALPATTGRVAPAGTYGPVVAADAGRMAGDVLAEVALHCGGAVAWERGMVNFISLYDQNGVTAAKWDDRHIYSLETPQGADRRMPMIWGGYSWDRAQKKFVGQVQFTDMDAFYGSGLANLYDITTLTDSLCAWGDQAETQYLVQQFAKAFSTGVRIWKVKTVFAWPWLCMGDQVVIATDQYAEHVARYDSAGTTDSGFGVQGPITATGRIVGKNLWGTEFAVLIPGVGALASSYGAQNLQGGPFAQIAQPSDFAVTANIQGDPATGLSAWVTASYTPPANAYFLRMDYQVASRRTGESTWGAAVTVVGSRRGVDRIVAQPGTDVQVTPVTVSTGNARLVGTASVVSVPFWVPAAPTFSSDVASSTGILYGWAWDQATVSMQVWTQEYTASPTGVLTAENAGVPWAKIEKAGGLTALTIPLAAQANYRVTTFIPYDAYGRRGTVRTTTTQGSATTAGGPPGTPTNNSVTGLVISNRVPLNASATTSWKLRVYVNGVQTGSDVALLAADITATFKDISTTVAAPSTGYAFTYSHIDASGLETAKSPSLSVTSGTATIPTPTCASAIYDTDIGAIVVGITPGASTPAGVTWHLKQDTSNPPTTEDASAASTATTLNSFVAQTTLVQTRYCKVWGVLAGWTNSADSNVKSCSIPKLGGGL
jgi:hypothetical protein